MKTLTLKSARATKALAAWIAKKILRGKPEKNARVIGLVGDLGSGKTTFIQGFIKALGVKTRIVSPTFLIFRPYPLPKRAKNFRMAIHADLYRIHSSKELTKLGFKELLGNPQNIILIEWADKIKKFLPKNTLWIKLEHGNKENIRKIEII